MIRRFWQLITYPIGLLVIGFAALAALLLIASTIFELPLVWVAIILAAALASTGALWYFRRHHIRQASANLATMITGQAAASTTKNATQQHESEAIHQQIIKAVSTIKKSKLGQLSGDAALYELPWYMIIGSPAAGKSTAITNSGLTFPFTESKTVSGVGGTRNCDFFFTTEGIMIDTAGRYSVGEEDRAEWFNFLDFLKKYRKRAPINGIIIAVNIDELTHERPEFAIELAKNLRQRVHELTERLEVHAPIYVMFTKADLIAGFNEFFQDVESNRIWGATLPYSMTNTGQDVLALFDKHFEELYDGLKELSLANMEHQRRARMLSGVFTFPLEFSTRKNALRAFIGTLFQENPYQFKPVFRGFYFTSARQEGESVSASSQRVAQRFDLNAETHATSNSISEKSYFLLNLFRNVIFADKDLVAQYASTRKTRLRYVTFIAAASLTGLAFGGWYWSSNNNLELVNNVKDDLDKVVKLQERRSDLGSRLEALEIIQNRIEYLNTARTTLTSKYGLGLYQGEYLERKLREEYFSGLKEVMLIPITRTLESFLKEVNTGADKLQQKGNPQQSSTISSAGATTPAAARNSTTQFKDASPANAEEAYNALKTYLMLGKKLHPEPSHLNDQLTRFWRVWLENNRNDMPREKMNRIVGRMIPFYLRQINDPLWQLVESNDQLVEQTRNSLKRVKSGMPARERVYADIKARAATSFKGINVAGIVGEDDKDLVQGSHEIQGTFTREAWEKFVQNAIKEAATKREPGKDLVLDTSSVNDLSFVGSPEQIQKELIDLYTKDYIKEWQKFIQDVRIKEFDGFDSATSAMNHLGDPQLSPINKLIAKVYQETSWDSPSPLNTGLQQAQHGVFAWFKEKILRQAPAQVPLNLGNDSATRVEIKMGPIGREFSGVARLMISKDKGASLMQGYLNKLSHLRVRLNQIKDQGNIGPGTMKLMQQTLSTTDSELVNALKYVDEQMLTGMTDKQKQAIRPLLVPPIMQTFAVVVKSTETEINKQWVAEVQEPFQRILAAKSPFNPESNLEASSAEISSVFGPEGAVAKFFKNRTESLLDRHGDALSAKTWVGMGISLAPSVITSFPGWIAPLNAGGIPTAPTATAAAETPTNFELQALSAIGAREFTIEIDGQQSNWRGQPEPSVQMTSPNGQAKPGVRITAILPDGRSVVIFEDTSEDRLTNMGKAADREEPSPNVFNLSWRKRSVTVRANLKLGQTQGAPTAAQSSQGFKNMKLPTVIVGAAAPLGAGLTTPAQTTGVTP